MRSGLGDDEPFKPKSEHRSVFLIYKGTMTDKELLKKIKEGFEASKVYAKQFRKKIGAKKDGSIDKRTKKYRFYVGKLNQKQDSD